MKKIIGRKTDLLCFLLQSRDEKTKYELSEHKDKRSLTANGYLWVLLQKIADVLRSTKDEVYEEMLNRYGQLQTDEKGEPYKITVKSEVDMSKIEGHYKRYKSNGKFTAYFVIKGSSKYSKKEMAILLDGVISECKELDIETKPEEEIKNLLENLE